MFQGSNQSFDQLLFKVYPLWQNWLQACDPTFPYSVSIMMLSPSWLLSWSSSSRRQRQHHPRARARSPAQGPHSLVSNPPICNCLWFLILVRVAWSIVLKVCIWCRLLRRLSHF